MGKELNTSALRDAMQSHGFNQARLAREVGVSRAAVSKWLNQRDFPRPDKLLKLGLLLQLGFKQLVTEIPEVDAPVVAFRRKGKRKTREEHLERAAHMGRLLRRLVPLLPSAPMPSFDQLSTPPTLHHPEQDYGYLQRVARKVRQDIGAAEDAPLRFSHLVGRFSSLHAVIIPVLWGDKQHHENALHIYLPDSVTTWVYLNLDSNIHDFKFWMAHELGHAYAPQLTDDAGEDFADGFAQALLFPEASAKAAYRSMAPVQGTGNRINRMKEIAREHGISPTTVSFALEAYACQQALPRLDVGDAIHPASTNFNKEFPTLSEELFSSKPPVAREYITVAREAFGTPFFDALGEYMRQTEVSVGFVETVLQLPLRDAKEIVTELR